MYKIYCECIVLCENKKIHEIFIGKRSCLIQSIPEGTALLTVSCPSERDILSAFGRYEKSSEENRCTTGVLHSGKTKYCGKSESVPRKKLRALNDVLRRVATG
ncbi:hypothetical protein O3G_MSEX001010 [Manduca sexta]|nr:hypothetical protein O3G_MSEX001010 [Manduca sexta]